MNIHTLFFSGIAVISAGAIFGPPVLIAVSIPATFVWCWYCDRLESQNPASGERIVASESHVLEEQVLFEDKPWDFWSDPQRPGGGRGQGE